ncbi:MAG: hypothetical protein LUE09_12110 [Synergistaceae bacterium]|nr:hypothetical protein [Synergistaceae bacterium]
MSTENKPSSGSNSGTIGVFTLAMMNVAAIVSLRGLPAEAEYGLSSVFYYMVIPFKPQQSERRR